MSVSLSEERDRIQRQVEQLEQSLSATYPELELLSSETGDESDGDDAEEERQCAAGLLAQREKIQNEIQNLEEVLGPHSPICVSDDDDDSSSSSSSEESELGLSPSADSCLQMNLVYQQVVQETLDQLETLLTHNSRQQKELVSQLSGPIKESSKVRPVHPSCQQPINMYLGRFLKPYFKDNLTGLGPPANQETKEKASRMTGCLDEKKLKVKRWESWQKTLLFHSVTRDSLRRLIQPKLSKVDYLSQKLSRAAETDKQQLRQQMDILERDIELLRAKEDSELVGGRYDEHDWAKISNIDFEGTREAEDIYNFWQNFLHPSICKTTWSQEEVQRLKEVSRRHGERHWDTIASELGTGRTAFLCLQTFQRFVSDSLKRGVWVPEEDALLRELVDKMRIGNFIPYTQLSYFMEGRDPSQLIYRWNQVLDPSLKKGFWTKEEDQLLLHAVSRFGEKDWWKIRFEVPGRSDTSCRDRYYDCLKAETKRGVFDQQEKQLLLLLVQKHGVGHWAKIAAEIPHRYDAQCLREWRRQNRAAQSHPKKPKTTGETSGGETRPTRRKNRRRKVILKVEESSEEEEVEVVYMDSDEEKSTKTKEEVVQSAEEEEEQEQQEQQEEQQQQEERQQEERQQEEEQQESTFPSMQDWIPAGAQCFTSLSFRPVELPSSGLARNQVPVRSTILGPFGRSGVLGPGPKELLWTESCGGSNMMMVSPQQLRAYLNRQVEKYSNRRTAPPPKKIHTNKLSPLSRAMDLGLVYELQAAVTPWIGNVLIPQEHRATAAQALRERGGAARLLSTPVFLLLLQAMNVDALGCKEMIEQRKNGVLVLDPPAPTPVSIRHGSMAELLQQKKLMEQEEQRKLILNQLQVLYQPPMPPQMHPRMSSVSFPRAVFIPHTVSPPAFAVPVALKATSTCSAAVHQDALPKTQNLMVAASCSTKPGPAPSPSSLISRPRKGRGRKVAEDQKEGVVGGANNGEGRTCGRLIRERKGRRTRKLNLKARAVQMQLLPPTLSVAPPPSMPTYQQLSSSTSSSPTPFLNDHDYTCFILRLSPLGSAPNAPQKAPPCRKKQGRKKADECVGRTGKAGGGASPGVIERGKRKRTPQEATRAKAEAEKKRSSLKKRTRAIAIRIRPTAGLPGVCLFPRQSMWVMTPGGMVKLVDAPPQGGQLTLVPHTPLPAQLVVTSPCPPTAASVPVHPFTSIMRPDSHPGPSLHPSFHPQPQPKLFMPYMGTKVEPPSLHFDPSLMFPESQDAVCDWLSGRGGVVVPGLAASLPYLPPFVSSLNTLSALLRSKTSLTKSSLKLLCRGSETQWPTTGPPGSTKTSQPPELPDSTSDLGPDTPAPSVSPDLLQEEEELVEVLRQLVAERFSGNPAYQLLKARFLSCFTLPALLATVRPIRKETVTCPTNKEVEEVQEELKKIKGRGRQRRAEKSLLLCDGAPANHYSGIHSAGAPLSR
ncbi:snRNA-activating protein complex subunit 4 [Pseudoliparis swirei]|uniref:snRNA-activating protein complex subunit 4 n=1 Tax=Pseudoliparis swirei TaxID=2059687 RepID=UPI0024BE4590|nr:snRNA-activating protein complex subunit 4 [Pseudoliparis swirei]